MTRKVATCLFFLVCLFSSISQTDSIFEKQLHKLLYTAGYIEKRADLVDRCSSRRKGTFIRLRLISPDNVFMLRKTKLINGLDGAAAKHKLMMGKGMQVIIHTRNQHPVYLKMIDKENYQISTFILVGENHWTLIFEEKGDSRLITRKNYKISDWTE